MLAGQSRAKAVVLLSGGMDSAVCLHSAQAQGFAVYALSFRYGQRHGLELRSAEAMARALAVEGHLFFDLSVEAFGGSALTDAIPVPKGGTGDGIPVTYVPARNTVFLSLALAWAETLGAHDLFIGVNAVDFSGYPDCRPAFIAAFERLANVATREGVEQRPYRIHAPLLHLSKAEIIRQGVALGVDFSHTLSCYDPDGQGRACGACDACRLRLAGFAAEGLADPAVYR
ncbi:MAG: 7-cyano-7-deazaguanine synthase QueC [Magnetococcales bacterium]|nr:7-cyano-7-deazaguanine synthase QueC [Magnetococcales bacterium]